MDPMEIHCLTHTLCNSFCISSFLPESFSLCRIASFYVSQFLEKYIKRQSLDLPSFSFSYNPITLDCLGLLLIFFGIFLIYVPFPCVLFFVLFLFFDVSFHSVREVNKGFSSSQYHLSESQQTVSLGPNLIYLQLFVSKGLLKCSQPLCS